MILKVYIVCLLYFCLKPTNYCIIPVLHYLSYVFNYFSLNIKFSKWFLLLQCKESKSLHFLALKGSFVSFVPCKKYFKGL